jgi:hypothetical protein
VKHGAAGVDTCSQIVPKRAQGNWHTIAPKASPTPTPTLHEIIRSTESYTIRSSQSYTRNAARFDSNIDSLVLWKIRCEDEEVMEQGSAM